MCYCSTVLQCPNNQQCIEGVVLRCDSVVCRNVLPGCRGICRGVLWGGAGCAVLLLVWVLLILLAVIVARLRVDVVGRIASAACRIVFDYVGPSCFYGLPAMEHAGALFG